jgi:hypothetical protein
MLEIGKTSPPPASVEAQAGALTGREPSIKMRSGQPGQPDEWYPQVPRAIRMPDGSGIIVEHCDQHPDPLCEALRWQVCEAEAMQSLGRTRWINRDAPEKALTVGIVHNAVLPITVNAVMPWQTPSAVVEMPVDDGIILTSPWDMTAIWPKVWKTVEEAKWALHKLRALARRRAGTPVENSMDIYPIEIPTGVPMSAALYQRRGPKQKFRWVFFDPSRVPNPRAWLESTLGALANFAHIFFRKGEILWRLRGL